MSASVIILQDPYQQKLKHTYSSINKQKNHYFNRLPKIYDSLPILNFNTHFNTLNLIISLQILTMTIHTLIPSMLITIVLSSLNH